MECVKSKIDSMGMDNLDRESIEELKAWAGIAKDVTEYDYYYHITEAMEKPENHYGVNYDENGRFYTQPRNMRGQFTRGYVHDPMMENYRDMDSSMGRMYYTDNYYRGYDGINHNSRGYSESRYDRAKRGYEESKNVNPSSDHMTEIEEIFETFSDDLKELKPKMTSNEKMVARNKLSSMSNMLM